MPTKTELEKKLKEALLEPNISQVLNQIAKIRLKAAMLSDGQLRVEFKNYCDFQSLEYLSRIEHT